MDEAQPNGLLKKKTSENQKDKDNSTVNNNDEVIDLEEGRNANNISKIQDLENVDITTDFTR